VKGSPRQRVLKLVLVASIVGYATGRSYEAALFLSGQMQPASGACSAPWCSVTLSLNLWAGYLCAPLAIVTMVFLARSTRVSSIVGGSFLLVMLASDVAALVALWRYFGFSEPFWGPNRDDILIARLVVPALGATAALLVWKRNEPARRAV